MSNKFLDATEEYVMSLKGKITTEEMNTLLKAHQILMEIKIKGTDLIIGS